MRKLFPFYFQYILLPFSSCGPFFHSLSSHARGMALETSVCQLVDHFDPDWNFSNNISGTDYNDILYTYSWSLTDEIYWFWSYPHLYISTPMRLTFLFLVNSIIIYRNMDCQVLWMSHNCTEKLIPELTWTCLYTTTTPVQYTPL